MSDYKFSSSPRRLVGTRLSVYWPNDDKWFDGWVQRPCVNRIGEFVVYYDDGQHVEEPLIGKVKKRSQWKPLLTPPDSFPPVRVTPVKKKGSVDIICPVSGCNTRSSWSRLEFIKHFNGHPLEARRPHYGIILSANLGWCDSCSLSLISGKSLCKSCPSPPPSPHTSPCCPSKFERNFFFRLDVDLKVNT